MAFEATLTASNTALTVLYELEGRLELINGLKRKYGRTIGEILAFGERGLPGAGKGASQRSPGGGAEVPGDGPTEAGRRAGGSAFQRPGQQAAKRLADAIEEEVCRAGLGTCPGAGGYPSIRLGGRCGRLGLRPRSRPQHLLPVASPSGASRLTGTGIDSVEFLVSLNPGEPPRPLARIASGGEASRLMLAIKAILSTADQVPILVFDEVDAGVGGRGRRCPGQENCGICPRATRCYA